MCLKKLFKFRKIQEKKENKYVDADFVSINKEALSASIVLTNELNPNQKTIGANVYFYVYI